MTKFNKSLLTIAVAGALALPGVASAAKFIYDDGEQITYAKDLFVDNTKSIDSPNNLLLIAEASDDTTGRIANIAANEVLTVKVTLGQGAVFDSTYPAETLVQLFWEGDQTGGAPGLIDYVAGTANYNGNELNFQYEATAAGDVTGDYFLKLNSAKIKNLISGLFDGDKITAQITVQNGAGQQILAGKVDYAKSKWGLTVDSDTTQGDVDTTIDVAADPRKSYFSSVGTVGADDQATFNAGSLTLDIAEATLTGNVGDDYVNNYSATAGQPDYNVVSTADIIVKVSGSDFAAFTGNRVWLDQNQGCTKAANSFTNGVVSNNNLITFTSPANSNLWQNVTDAPPAPSTVYVCFGADHEDEIQAQELKGELEVKYNLDQQRVDPPKFTFDLLPLRLNGSTLYFQNVNPGSNPTAQSFLRLSNHNADVCPVTIDAKDDAGRLSDSVSLTLKAHASAQLNTTHLDGGSYPAGLVTNTGVSGALGTGTGKWYVRVTAECSNFTASALNRNNESGTVTDLTAEKGVATQWSTPTAKVNP